MDISTERVKVQKIVEEDGFVVRLSRQELADLRTLVYIAATRGQGPARDTARVMWGELENHVPARDVTPSWYSDTEGF